MIVYVEIILFDLVVKFFLLNFQFFFLCLSDFFCCLNFLIIVLEVLCSFYLIVFGWGTYQCFDFDVVLSYFE